jgi:hypothetical protein
LNQASTPSSRRIVILVFPVGALTTGPRRPDVIVLEN